MYIRILALVALSLLLFTAPSYAATPGSASCTPGDGNITCDFTPTPAGLIAIYDFTSSGRGYLVVQFDTVLTNFALTVTPTSFTDTIETPDDFPVGTVCVGYDPNGGSCVQYNFSGTAMPNGVPVKDVDYKGMITLTLSYLSTQPVHEPAFGHAPGDTTVITDDILSSYSAEPPCTELTCTVIEPTMSGKTPGLSSVVALDEPLPASASNFCFIGALSAVRQTSNSQSGNPLIEVSFKLENCVSGAAVKDKTATLSVAQVDPSGNFATFPSLINGGDANKFHWDGKNGINVQDVNTVGLMSGQQYTVTVISSVFSPQSAIFTAP